MGHEQLRAHTWSEEQNDMIKEAAGSRPAVALAGAFSLSTVKSC